MYYLLNQEELMSFLLHLNLVNVSVKILFMVVQLTWRMDIQRNSG